MYAGMFDLGLGWECGMNVFVLKIIFRIIIWGLDRNEGNVVTVLMS